MPGIPGMRMRHSRRRPCPKPIPRSFVNPMCMCSTLPAPHLFHHTHRVHGHGPGMRHRRRCHGERQGGAGTWLRLAPSCSGRGVGNLHGSCSGRPHTVYTPGCGLGGDQVMDGSSSGSSRGGGSIAGGGCICSDGGGSRGRLLLLQPLPLLPLLSLLRVLGLGQQLLWPQQRPSEHTPATQHRGGRDRALSMDSIQACKMQQNESGRGKAEAAVKVANTIMNCTQNGQHASMRMQQGVAKTIAEPEVELAPKDKQAALQVGIPGCRGGWTG